MKKKKYLVHLWVFTDYTDDKVNVTKQINNYVISHLTNADLCIKYFDDFKAELTIVDESLITLTNPLKVENYSVIMLLAPAGNRNH